MNLEINLAPIFEDKLVVDTVTVLEHLVQAWENTDADAMISARFKPLSTLRKSQRQTARRFAQVGAHTT